MDIMKLIAPALLGLCLASMACGAVGPEDIKIAKAEYGLANDSFHRGKYREALTQYYGNINVDTLDTTG